MTYSSSSAASYSQSGKGFDKDSGAVPSPKESWKVVDVPLVFVPGMKGTHLAFDDSTNEIIASNANKAKKKKKKRAWLTLGNLLNFPPRPDNDPSRDLSLPLTYDHTPPGPDEDGYAFASHYPKQHRGELVPDGIVDHIIELNVGDNNNDDDDSSNNKTITNFVDLNFLPFYGHTTRMLREIDREYHARRHDGKLESTESFQKQDDYDETLLNNGKIGSNGISNINKGIFDQAGSFVERTSNWAFSNATNSTAREQQSHHSLKHCRPTAIFQYDWRRPLPELCTALHEFCEETFPNEPVQIIAHSLGGLMSFDAMRKHPAKYAPGAVVVGVPFETGIQYLQDLHKGYFTELDRCRQFTPEKQFTMSSHWGFFPITKDRLEDRFVDVTERCEAGQQLTFEADKSGIGKKAIMQPKVEGDNAYFDFYSADAWESLDIGIFGPEYDNLLTDKQRQEYKDHMQIQMDAAKKWRQTVLGEGHDNEKDYNAETFLPPFVACASNALPTINQVLRRKRKSSQQNTFTRKGRSSLNRYEYDYVSGRSVPGDGRIDFDKAFPPGFVTHKRVALDSAHAKQMCWEESGGSWGRIYEEVVEQAEAYLKAEREREEREKEEREKEKISAKASLEVMLENNDEGRGKSVVKRIVFRAKNARKRFQRRRLDENASARPNRLSLRRRRRK
eukprot:CAMPEP_0183709146 /NCGR_PEP_ID=MMETSP0737-20130205/5250_1 /TAXON_ID=385413 /ORGANISM="Thalassiosira miniscula, Strain CCMP1093" /LENGTH=674 /DNA_ID=CAMNT_0025937161 /DNA_START=507 /DNA_END=2531 /DNA_ORIENTATION=-